MASINAKKGNRDGNRAQRFFNHPATRIAGLALGRLNPAIGAGLAIGRIAAGLPQRIGYMFDNDSSTGFWRGENAGKPLFGGIGEGARNMFGNLFGNGDQPGAPYSGAPSQGFGYTAEQANAANEASDRANASAAYDAATSAGYVGSLLGAGGLGALTAGQRFNQNMPNHWRRTGTSANWGGGGGGIDGFAVFANDRGTIQRNNFVR